MTHISPSILKRRTTWLARLMDDAGRSRRVDSDREQAYRVLHNASLLERDTE